MNRTSLWWAKGGLAVSQSITPVKRAASRPTHPSPSLALDALAAIGQTLRKSRQANVPQTPGLPCRMTCVSLRSPADRTDSSPVVHLDPRPPVALLGRVREYHPLDCRTPWSRTSTSDAALARRVGAVQPATRDHAIR